MKRSFGEALRSSERPRCAIVTGGSSGVGLAIVAALLKAHDPPIAKVFVTGRKPRADTTLDTLLKATPGAESRELYDSGDTTDAEVVSRQWSAALDHFEGAAPSAIFLNAGIGGGRHALEAFDIERFDAIFRVNTRGPFLWFKQALPALKAQPETSQIVVTSSVAALRGVPQGGPYAASKWAINGLVLSLREELKNSHPQVKVGLVCPGPIATAWWDEFERGGRGADAPPTPAQMLSAESVARACMSLYEQDETSNLEQVVLEPTLK